jgi:hypothetical protein
LSTLDFNQLHFFISSFDIVLNFWKAFLSSLSQKTEFGSKFFLCDCYT